MISMVSFAIDGALIRLFAAERAISPPPRRREPPIFTPLYDARLIWRCLCAERYLYRRHIYDETYAYIAYADIRQCR